MNTNTMNLGYEGEGCSKFLHMRAVHRPCGIGDLALWPTAHEN